MRRLNERLRPAESKAGRFLRGKAWLSVVMLLGGFLSGFAATPMDPDALTIEDFAFIPGVKRDFIEAYKVFLKAKAGDQEKGRSKTTPTYGQAAQAFRKAATGGDPEIELSCVWLMTFCQFLQMDVGSAAQSAKKTLDLGKRLYPKEIKPLEDLVAQVNRGELASLKALAESMAGESSGEKTTQMTHDVVIGLSKMVERNRRTKELKQKVSGYDLRTKVFDAGSIKEQLTAIVVLAGMFQKMSISLSQNRVKIEQAICIANIRQLGVCLHLYAQDHKGVFPAYWDPEQKETWQEKILPYTEDAEKVSWENRSDVWKCPSGSGFGYGINNEVTARALYCRIKGIRDHISRPREMMLLADSVGYMYGDYPDKPNYGGAAYHVGRSLEGFSGTVDWNRHSGGSNVLFVDGHVEWNSGVGVKDAFWAEP